jgi:hypothetical protein
VIDPGNQGECDMEVEESDRREGVDDEGVRSELPEAASDNTE